MIEVRLPNLYPRLSVRTLLIFNNFSVSGFEPTILTECQNYILNISPPLRHSSNRATNLFLWDDSFDHLIFYIHALIFRYYIILCTKLLAIIMSLA